jgi:hypothetical protein
MVCGTLLQQTVDPIQIWLNLNLENANQRLRNHLRIRIVQSLYMFVRVNYIQSLRIVGVCLTLRIAGFLDFVHCPEVRKTPTLLGPSERASDRA